MEIFDKDSIEAKKSARCEEMTKSSRPEELILTKSFSFSFFSKEKNPA